MNDVQLLWVGVLALILLSLGVLLPALLVEVAPESPPRSAAALRGLYQTQLAELERERAGERLSAADHAQAVDELQARLLAELERRTPAGLRRHSVWLQRGSGLLLAVLVLPLSIPVLIFGVAASNAAVLEPAGFGAPLSILCALSLAGLVIGPLAAAASLRHGLD